MTLVSSRGLFAVWKPPTVGSAKVTEMVRAILQGGHTLKKRDQVFKMVMSANNSGDSSILCDFTITKTKKEVWVKVGHGGTLDRSAEGVLVIGVGRDCKILENYLMKDKAYIFTGELGKMTDTLDSRGILIRESPWKHITQDDLEESLKQFRGNILQTPPIFSALKVNGKRMSDLAIEARSTGIPMLKTPQPRPVTIKLLELLKFEPPHFTLSVHCSSGTYVRSLARDIGFSLDTVCYTTSLARTRQGEFTRETALKVEDWTADKIKAAIEESKKLLGSN